MAPTPDGDAHVEPALAVHVHVMPVKAGGNTSLTVTPATSLGPRFVTTIV